MQWAIVEWRFTKNSTREAVIVFKLHRVTLTFDFAQLSNVMPVDQSVSAKLDHMILLITFVVVEVKCT